MALSSPSSSRAGVRVEASLKRRRVIKILGSAAGAPLIASGGVFSEAIALGRRIRADIGTLPGEVPATLTAAQDRVVTALAEIIIPETDTPGATAGGVNEFVDALVTGWLDETERDRFLTGIDTVDPAAQAAHGADFADCAADQQAAHVSRLDEEVDRLRQDPEADETEHFFYDMKRFTLAGYFTSEVGLRTLGYRVVPGAFEGCVLIDQYGSGGPR